MRDYFKRSYSVHHNIFKRDLRLIMTVIDFWRVNQTFLANWTFYPYWRKAKSTVFCELIILNPCCEKTPHVLVWRFRINYTNMTARWMRRHLQRRLQVYNVLEKATRKKIPRLSMKTLRCSNTRDASSFEAHIEHHGKPILQNKKILKIFLHFVLFF